MRHSAVVLMLVAMCAGADWRTAEFISAKSGGHLVDDPLSDAIAGYHGKASPTTRQRLMSDYGYTRVALRYLSQGELERLQGAIDTGAITPPVIPGVDAARQSTIPEVGTVSSHTRELAVICAAWCSACQPVKAIAADCPGVRVLDLYRDQAEIVRLYGKMPSSLPAYITVVDGRGIKNWYGATNAAGIEIMRDWTP